MLANCKVDIEGAVISGNQASNSGGAIWAEHSAISITVKNTTFTNNRADFGGAIHSAVLTIIENCTFENNSAKNGGGAIFMASAQVQDNEELIVKNSTFSGNKARYGGAISTNVKASTASSRFEGNIASSYGGAIDVTESARRPGASLIADNTTFTQNKAGRGGAIFTYTGKDTTITNNTSFTENEATVEGGALYSRYYSYADPAEDDKYSKLYIDSTTSFEDNKAAYPYQPPSNYNAFTELRFARTSFTGVKNPYTGEDILSADSLLNNNDINYKNTTSSALPSISYSFVDADGGSLPQDVQGLLPENSQAGSGSIVIPESPTKDTVELADGTWEFEGWDKSQVNIPQTGVKFTGTWSWTAKKYTVTFNTDGGTAVDSQTVTHGGTATKPADPTKANHDFAGWFADPALNNAFDFTMAITGETTVYAKWTTTPVELFSVTYVAEADARDVPIDNNQYPSGAKVTILGPPTREGYTFLGWRMNPLLQPGDSITIANAHIVLTAEWEKLKAGIVLPGGAGSTPVSPAGPASPVSPAPTATQPSVEVNTGKAVAADSNARMAVLIPRTGEDLSQTVLFGGLSLLSVFILLILRKCIRRAGEEMS